MQVVIALVVTPEGLPLAYEVLAGNTADSTTLRDFLARIENQYGQRATDLGDGSGHPDRGGVEGDARRDPPVHYLVGTPKGRLSQFEHALLAQSWQRHVPGWT